MMDYTGKAVHELVCTVRELSNSVQKLATVVMAQGERLKQLEEQVKQNEHK